MQLDENVHSRALDAPAQSTDATQSLSNAFSDVDGVRPVVGNTNEFVVLTQETQHNGIVEEAAGETTQETAVPADAVLEAAQQASGTKDLRLNFSCFKHPTSVPTPEAVTSVPVDSGANSPRRSDGGQSIASSSSFPPNKRRKLSSNTETKSESTVSAGAERTSMRNLNPKKPS